MGNKAYADVEYIPNTALKFIKDVADNVSEGEIYSIIAKDKNYATSLLNCVILQRDYLPLYPSKKYKHDGASHKLFLLYQMIVMGHSLNSLRTAFKVANYVKENVDESHKLGIDLDKKQEKRVRVRKLMVKMVAGGLLNFDEYYELFVIGNNSNSSHSWRLIKYYLLSELSTADFDKDRDKQEYQRIQHQDRPYKTRLIEVGKAMLNSYIARKGVKRFEREVLQGFRRGKINERWLWNQLKILEEESGNGGLTFDAQQTWLTLPSNNNMFELLYLLRLLWTDIYKETTLLEPVYEFQ